VRAFGEELPQPFARQRRRIRPRDADCVEAVLFGLSNEFCLQACNMWERAPSPLEGEGWGGGCV